MDSQDPFAVSFCGADGICHEKPDKPSPRTVYSSWTKQQYDQWWEYNDRLNKRAEEYSKKREQQTVGRRKRSLVFLGDSITESWEGTGLGIEKKRAFGIPQVFENRFQKDFDPIVLAAAGDQTQHLLYRMINGQLPSDKENDAIYVVMIGTNNLGSGELPGPTANGILAVATYVLENTQGRLLLFQVLPRGDVSTLETLCPPRCSSEATPFSSFLPAINKVNEQLSRQLTTLKDTYGSDRIQLMDCGERFLNNNKENKNNVQDVNLNLMPDLLHPNQRGHRILAECITSHI